MTEINGTNGIAHWYIMRPALQPGQHPSEYGPIALKYMLAADVELFGLFTDAELDAIHHAAHHAVTGPNMEPRAVDIIAALSLRIVAVLDQRAQETQPATKATTEPPTHQQDDHRDGGHTEPRQPLPKTNPPAPAMAEPAWSF